MRAILPVVLLILISLGAEPVSAQQGPPPAGCRGSEHRQFDFWIGEWEVRTANGRLAGTNQIRADLEGCVLIEEWSGTGSRGMSINFYDGADASWHQTWIDDRGKPLYLTGGLRDGSMVLEGTTRGADGKTVRQRITWTPLDGDEVRQHWQSSTDDGATWTTVFDGRYIRIRPG